MQNTATKCPSCGHEGSGKFCHNCGAPLAQATCSKCQATLSPGARFCHACGTPLAAQRTGSGDKLPWMIAGALAVIVVVVVGVQMGSGGPPPPAPSPVPASQQPASDLSNMPPREQADRLFNRVMAAHERGDSGEVSFFKPMAVQAYTMLEGLDFDARYHVGLMHAVTGDPEASRLQLDSLAQESPNHLLASMLRATLGQLNGDEQELRRAYRAFLDAYDSEMASAKQEYTDHQGAIQAFREQAQRALANGSQ